MGPLSYPPLLEPNRQLEQEPGHEQEVGYGARTSGRSRQTGHDKKCSQTGHAAVERMAEMHEQGIRAVDDGMTFGESQFHLLAFLADHMGLMTV